MIGPAEANAIVGSPSSVAWWLDGTRADGTHSGYPWFILVPEREDAREIFELAEADRLALIEEIAMVTRAVSQAFGPDKLNVAALGNIVPQLHVHVIARFRSDPAWPAPVWGRTEAHPYTEAASADVRRRIEKRLGAALSPAG